MFGLKPVSLSWNPVNVGAVQPRAGSSGAGMRNASAPPQASVSVVNIHSVISFEVRIFHRRTGRVSSNLSVPSALSAETMSLPRIPISSGRRRRLAATLTKRRTNSGAVGRSGSMSWSM